MTIFPLLAFPTLFFGLGMWILSPVDRAARRRQQPVKFSIADFLCLFVTVQIPLSLIAWMRLEELDEAFWVCTALAWIAGPLIWYTAARAISRAGVAHGIGRLAFMGGVVPMVYYGLLPFTALFCVGMYQALESGNPLEPLRQGYGTLATVALGAALIGCGTLNRALIRKTLDTSAAGR